MKPIEHLKNGRVDFDRFFEKNPNELTDEEADDNAGELVRQHREDRAVWKGKQSEKGKDE